MQQLCETCCASGFIDQLHLNECPVNAVGLLVTSEKVITYLCTPARQPLDPGVSGNP